MNIAKWSFQRIAGVPDTIDGQQNREIRVQSDTADNIAWARYASAASDSKSSHSSLSSASYKPQVEFKHLLTPIPLHAAIQEATAIALFSPERKLIVVTGRSRRLTVENHKAELKTLMSEHGCLGAEVRKTVGDVASGFMVAGVESGVVVVQAAIAL
jgi:hypothetical protein